MLDVYSTVEHISAQKNLRGAQAVLLNAVQRMGMSHVAYVGLNLPFGLRKQPIVAVSYPDEWQRRYREKSYDCVDPVMTACLKGVVPVDWSSISHAALPSKQLFEEARQCGIGPSGLSIPIRGPHGELAVFSVSADVQGAEWVKLRTEHVANVMLLSCHFHEWSMRAFAPTARTETVTLSAREIECLRWSAMGKSLWDISTILNLSERTVRFHLDNVRTKLDAVNTVQAAVKATHLGLIS